MKVFTCPPHHPSALKRLGLLLLGVVLTGSVYAGDNFWTNSGTINTAPQIDATNFVNTGTINIGTTLPFETSDTLNYTNSGTMFASPGWEFDFAPPNAGFRYPAANFVNLNDGTIAAFDGAFAILLGTNGFLVGSSSTPSYLWVNATNIVNKGTLAVGGEGWLKMTGTNINVARSGLEVTALQPTGDAVIGGTNYINDVGISDVWWGQTNIGFNSPGVWTGTTATAPPHGVQRGIGGFGGNVTFSIPNPIVFGYSNSLGGQLLTLTNMDGSTTNVFVVTNIIKQAVFVGVSDPSLLTVDASFFPSSTFTNPFRTVSVRLALQSTNVVTQQLESTTLFFYDTLASETNRGLAVNINGTSLPPFVTQRPANYRLSRLDTGRFRAGVPGNITPDPNFLYDPTTYSNAFVTGEYAGYNAQVSNLATEPPPVSPGGVTNFPGRVQILGETVDLHNTRIRGEGEVIINATHLLSSVGTAVDCENLSYQLGATNGNLNVVNLSKQSVIRLQGNLLAWSGLWSNQATIVLTNNFVVTNTVDTNGVITGTNAVPSPLTNTVSVGLYALILDGDGLLAHVPVTTWDLVTHSTNIVISDSLNLVESLLLDGQSFTLNGTLNLTSKTLSNTRGQSVTTSLLDWFGTNAPGLLYFTNNGTLNVPDQAHLGDDLPVPYSDFVNTGSMRLGSLDVNSTYLENDSTINVTVGPANFVGQIGRFQGGGSTSSSGDLNFFIADLKFLNHTLTSVGALNFNDKDALSDAGPGFPNTFTTANGFSLAVKPATGDLLGTTIIDSPPDFVEVDHVWAAEDRGATAAGFANNAALGKLVLSARNNSGLQAPLLFFTGTNGQRALYVDLLDLTSLGSNYMDILEIDPSLTIYYAAAKLSFTPPPNAAGIPQQPEEFLNGQFGGHLVWDSSFAGPNSSVDVIINGVTVSVNSALRFSKIIDSNNNGLPNFYDPFPFDANPLVLSAAIGGANPPAPGAVSVSWQASPHKTYQVEYRTDMHSGWQALTQYTHNSDASSTVSIWDTNAPAGSHRFYRVKTTP